MRINRTINKVTIDEIDDTLVIAFGKLSSAGVPEEYVMLQGQFSPPDETDVDDNVSEKNTKEGYENEEDEGIYIERDDQQFCGYGGIVRCVLRKDQLLLELDEEIGQALAEDEIWEHITLKYSIVGDTLARLRQELKEIFAEGSERFVDQT